MVRRLRPIRVAVARTRAAAELVSGCCVLFVLVVACGSSPPPMSPTLGGSAGAARPRCDRAYSAAHPADVDCTITVFETFAEQICACRDTDCVEKVNTDMTQWAKDLTNNTKQAAEPSGEQAKRLTAAMDRYNACTISVPSSDPCGD